MSEKYRPEQIYLQVTDDDGEALDVDTEEITWCADDQHQGDIKYIRADIVRNLEAVADAAKRVSTLIVIGYDELDRHIVLLQQALAALEDLTTPTK